MDLHLHTPASSDYEEPNITYLQWLRQARTKGLDIVAITDHNTVAGVRAVRQEIEWLTRLEEQGRLTEKEQAELAEWRSLANEI
ncbi:MAG: AAA family ATPase, partial [Gammaproteobacteria bacterium]